MADVLMHITGIARVKVEEALGYPLEPVSPAGDLFRVPEEVAKLAGDLPAVPPRASQSVRDKAAWKAMPVEADKVDADAVLSEDKALHDAVVDASKVEELSPDEKPKSRASSAKSSK